MHPSRIFTQGHRLFGMPRSAQNPDYSTHSDKLQFDLLPDSRRSVHHALILVIALVFLGTGTSLRAQNYNPNNFDSEYIMNAIKIPHSDLSIIAAHRGIHALVDGTNAYVPENSIKAIDLTAQAGIEVIELDVKLTSDTIPILSHDMTWGREWCYNMGGAFSNNTAFDPFTSQGSNSSNDGRDPTVASMSLSQTKNYREGTYGTYLRDSVSFYCSYYGQFTGAYPPTVQDALNEIKNKNIQMVVAFDIKDAATATAVWDIVANTSDSEGRSFAKSVLFKMPATAFQPNNTCSTAVQCFKNTFPTTNSLTYSAVNYFPYYSTSNISPSAFGSETEIINNIKTFQNEGTISIPAVEVDFKQNGGILDETLSYAKAYKGSSSTVGIFSPYAEYYYPSDTAQTPLFFTTRAYCCLSMAAYYYGPTMADLNAASSPNPATPFPTIPNPSYGAGQPTDTADDRGNYTFVTDNKFQLITTDRPQWYDKKLNDDKKRVLGPMQPNPSAASNTVSVALSASDASPAAGDNVELTVIISPSYATGTVTFTDNSTTLGTANVNNGSASFAVTSIVAGSHVYTAAYSGDATYLQNTSNSLTVTTQASATGGSTNYTGTTIAQQVAVPAYFYPPTYWSQLVAPVGFAVANVANGPNYGVDSNYVSAIAASHKAGTKVLGYVDTGYFGGTTPARTTRLNQTDVNSWTTQIEQDVDAWYSLYGSNGIDGIFFDDGQNVCGNNNQYVTLYTDILNYVKQNHPGAYVITNPGVSVPQCLQNIADTLLTYEGSYDCYINDSSCAAGQGYTPLTWTPVDPQKIYHIVYGIPDASLANASALTKQNNAGLVFLTSASLASNPYGSLPSFFAQEVTDALAGGSTDSTVPTAPVVANGSNGGTYATLSWTPSTDANGSGVVGYDVYQNSVKVTSVPASTAPQVTITGLLPATTYSFTVTARNVAGTVSAASNTLSVTTNPADGSVTAPAITSSVANATDVVLGWTAAQAGSYPLSYYDVFVNGTKVITVDTGVTSADVIGLSSSASYTFTVQARDTEGDASPMSSTVNQSTTSPPNASPCTVTSTTTTVTIGCNYWAPWGFHHVYIDADNKWSTGYEFGWTTTEMGADYLIENTNLEAYTGNGTTFSWSQIATEQPVITGSDSSGFTYTWTIPRSDFSGVPLGTTSLYLLNGTGYVQEAYSAVLTCGSPNCSASQ